MKRSDSHMTYLPRIKLLPACLAVALALGAGIPSTAASAATFRALPGGTTPGPFTPSVRHARPFSDADRRAFLDWAESRQRLRTIPAVPATAIAVTNCNDDGPGSYRQAMADAVSGDTIDLTHTGCSTITLTSGDVVTVADDLTLQGPGTTDLVIDGNDAYSTLQHLGTGRLQINDLTLAFGDKYVADGAIGNPAGGCASSQGAVALDNTFAKYCSARSTSTTQGVKGGAVYGKTGVILSSSLVSGSMASSSASFAYGGGVYSGGYFTTFDSLVTGNEAITTVGIAQGGGVEVGSIFGDTQPGELAQVKYSSIVNNAVVGGNFGSGGGLYTSGDVVVSRSTISGNQADYGAGLYLSAGPNITQPWTISVSTVSGNEATASPGGVWVGDNATNIQNSTIAFNTAQSTTDSKYGAGIRIGPAVTVDLQSTIVSNTATTTTSGEIEDDINGNTAASLTGANNLIVVPSLPSPGDTIVLTDPMLQPLASNGGSTLTHALSPLSPAIHTGNSTFVSNYDQRGDGYPRVIGPAADIGAYELDTNDVIFADSFD